MLNNMKISGRLKLLMSVMLFMALVLGGIGWYQASKLQQSLFSMYESHLVVLEQLSVIVDRSLENELIVSQAINHPESHAIFRKGINDNEAIIRKNMNDFLATHMSPVEKLLAGKLVEAHKRYLEEALKPAMESMLASDKIRTLVLFDSKVRPLYKELRSILDKLIENQLEEAKHANQESAEFAQKMNIMFIAIVLLGGGGSVAFGLSIIQRLDRSLTALRDAMVNMAEDGNLTARAKVFGKGEVGQAAMAFNGLIDSFSGILRQVSANASSVSRTASKLAATSHTIERSTEEQSSAAAATAAAIEQITVSINSVSENTEDVRKLSEQSMQQTELGNTSVRTMIAEITQVQNAVTQIAESVHEFVQSTQSISSMTQQVKDIADQTNLLALNAAIEAARAGEQGRGFAVVADEVRKLAEKSATSANEIDQVTTTLNQKSTHVDEVMQHGLRSLQSTQEQVARVSAMLIEAGNSVRNSTSGVNDIASSVSQQSEASNEIARNVERIAQMSEENHAAVKSSTEDVLMLDKLANELHEMVSRFKV